MKRILSAILATAFVLELLPTVSAAPAPFADMEGRWFRYQEAVEYLKGKEVLSGYPDGTFRPNDTINRAELLKIVFKGKSDTTPGQRRCFSDINPDEWYAPYVCAAKNRGIVKGYANGTFKPEEPVNFAEAIKIVLNAYGEEIAETPGANWYRAYTAKLEDIEILPEHSYIPWNPLTRERAADLLWRMLKREDDRFIAHLSPGCNSAPPTLPPTTVQVHGQDRAFLLTIPGSYKSHDPAPLVIAFHGRTNDNGDVKSYMRLDRELTDSIIAYPAALRNGNNTFSWADPGNKPQETRDIAFFDAIVEKLANTYCIDMDRISVVGHSLGAWMANTVACVRGDVIMASATVGGDSSNTKCSGPAAAMIVHNPKDTLAPFSGAEFVRKQRLETNICEPVPAKTGPAELNCERYTCTSGNDILWCPHTIDSENGSFYPHLWPKRTAEFIDAFLRSIK
jgi:polyhydroxybutyrate depolymerase